MTRLDLKLSGNEIVNIENLEDISPRKKVQATIGDKKIELELQIFTDSEVQYIINGGILQTVLKNIKR
jgi:aconitate hydratase